MALLFVSTDDTSSIGSADDDRNFAASVLLSLSRPSEPPVGPSRGFLHTLFGILSLRDPRIPTLPAEIVEDIIHRATGGVERLAHPFLQRRTPYRHPALTPPVSGASPFMSLSAELRRYIFAEHLGDRDKSFDPLCEGIIQDQIRTKKRQDPKSKIDQTKNSIAGLMTLNRRCCGEIGEVMYQERTFVIHVHEGLRSGGVEVLNAGRQPLQYQDCIEDTRFAKFADGDEFGFQRMKKVVIQIYPTNEDDDRHVAINTHFMNLALCRLLERPTNDRERMTSIKVEFVAKHDTPATNRTTRASIMRQEKPWANGTAPRSSSIHNITDIELALRPFAMLTNCHAASIEVPSYLAANKHLSGFVANLQESMKSRNGTLMPNDTLEYKVEALRSEMEAHVLFLRHGNGVRAPVAKLTEKDMAEDAIADSEEEADERRGTLGQRLQQFPSKKKHLRSPSGPNTRSIAAKRNKLADGQPEDEAASKRLIRSELAATKSGRSISWLQDAELATMSEDEQMIVALQLSVGQTRKQPREHSEELSGRTSSNKMENKKSGRLTNDALNVDEDFRGKSSDEEDWKTELIEQFSAGEVSAEVLEAMGVVVSTDQAREFPAATQEEHPLPAPLNGSMAATDYGTSVGATNEDFDHAAFARTAAETESFADRHVFNETTPPPVFRYSSSSIMCSTYTFERTKRENAGSIAGTFPQLDGQTPRNIIQAEDSGIGMLASDDRKESQAGGESASDVDEEMEDVLYDS